MDGKINNSQESAKKQAIESAKGNKAMKNWIATYTDDYGETSKTIPVQATTYTQAYVNAAIKIKGVITDLVEV